MEAAEGVAGLAAEVAGDALEEGVAARHVFHLAVRHVVAALKGEALLAHLARKVFDRWQLCAPRRRQQEEAREGGDESKVNVFHNLFVYQW